MDAEQISRNYGSSIVVRRWAATWLDTLLLVLVGIWLYSLGQKQTQAAVGIGILFLTLYYPLTEGLIGKTLGKFLCGLTVVNAQGRPPGIGKAVVRTLWRLIEVNPFLFGAIPAGVVVLSSKTRQRCGDSSSGTYVLCDEDLGKSWARRFWALPGAVLTTMAAAAFFVVGGKQTDAAGEQKPKEISFAQIVTKPPTEGYFKIKNCEIDITNALYLKETKDDVSTFTGYIPLKLPSMKKASLLLKTEDKKTLAILKKMDALKTADAGKKVIETFVTENLDELVVTRDVEGTISTSLFLFELKGEKWKEFQKENLSEEFTTVLQEGDKPISTEGVFSIMAGVLLGLVTALLWILTLIYASMAPPKKQF